MKKGKKRLRTGFTTGAAAAASAKGAVITLLENQSPETVSIRFLTGEKKEIRLQETVRENSNIAVCTVKKDAGDDPDVTHKAIIGARVEIFPGGSGKRIDILGGEGVGRITLPGLEVPPGDPAINLGPRKMITHSVMEILERNAWDGLVTVTVFVPEGRTLAKKTLNSRLGIVDGISILGTTGLVRPMSHEAYTETIRRCMSVACAGGLTEIVLTTGRRTERHAQAVLPGFPEIAFIQIGDYFRFSLESAAQAGFAGVIIAAFFGKALKMAQGIEHTHAARTPLVLTALSDWTRQLTGNRRIAEEIRTANTAREAFFRMHESCPDVVEFVAEKAAESAKRFAGKHVSIRMILFDFDGNIFCDISD